VFLLEDRERRGLFQGSWQHNDTHQELERLEPTDERSALAWARERADVVVIRLYEFMPYSAGAVNPWGGPEWPGLDEARAFPNTVAPPD
jgi:hypothetical protein